MFSSKSNVHVLSFPMVIERLKKKKKEKDSASVLIEIG